MYLAKNQYIRTMKKEDNKDIELRRYKSEMLRQNNEIVRLNSLVSFLMEENKTIAEEECQRYLGESNRLKEALAEIVKQNEALKVMGQHKDSEIADLRSRLSEMEKWL